MLNRIGLSVLIVLGLSSVLHAQFLGQQSLSQSSYIIDKDGALWAWGWNSNGQLGIGSTQDQSRPVTVPKPSGVSVWTSIAGGARHALAVGDSTKLYAWGYNGDGELGNGTTTDATTPVLIPNPTSVTAWKWVSAGQDHSMALATNGQLYAWGANKMGQLGTGDTLPSKTPKLVPLPKGVNGWAAVAAGSGATFAIGMDGHLYGWGVFPTFFLTFSPTTSPMLIWDFSGTRFQTNGPLTTLALSSYHFAAIGASGYGTMTNNGNTGGSGAQVAVGGKSALILYGNGGYLNWQCDTVIKDSAFVTGGYIYLTGVTQWTAAAAGLHHWLAMGNDGWLYAWGDNTVGALGAGGSQSQGNPIRVKMFGDSLAMSTSLSGPSTYPGAPFDLVLTDTCKTASGISQGDAFLVADTILHFAGSTALEPLSPNSITAGQTATAHWRMDADSARGGAQYAYYWAYVRAHGSAPYFAGYFAGHYPHIIIPAKQSGWIVGSVHDSLSQKPLAGISVVLTNGLLGNPDTAVTAADGTFSHFVTAPNNVHININSAGYLPSSTSIYSYGDTLRKTISLMPKPILGTFAVQGGQAPATFSKIFWVDSTTIYGIASSALIYRTTNRGGSWRPFVASPKGYKLHGLFFLSAKEGWVVGDLGTIEHTTDSGATWTSLPNATSHDLYGICGVNDHLWVCGDVGVVLHYRAGKVSIEGDPLLTRKLYSIYFLDTANGAACGESGIFESYDTANGWNRITSGFGDDLVSCYYSGGNSMAVGANGSVYVTIIGGRGNINALPHGAPPSLNQVYFVTPAIGYIVGDSGSSFVTYDGGSTWIVLPEMAGDVTSLNFFGADGLAFRGTSTLFFAGRPNPSTAIVHGRVTAADGMSSVSGSLVTLTTAGGRIDTAYTNEVGAYVFTDVMPGKIRLVCIGSDDSGGFTRVADTTAIADAVINVDFTKHVAPPPPRSVFEGASLPAVALSCDPNPITSQAVLNFTLPESGAIRLSLFDALGREVRVLTSGFESAGEHTFAFDARALPGGSYFARLMTCQGSATTLIVLTR